MITAHHKLSEVLHPETHHRQMFEKVKVIVTIHKGNVTAVLSGIPLDVVIVDYDNIEQGDPTPEQLSFEDGFNVQDFMNAAATQNQY